MLAAGLIYSRDEEVNTLNFLMMIVVFIFNAYFVLDWIYQFLTLFKKKYRFISPILTLFGRILLKKKIQMETKKIKKRFLGSVVRSKKKKKAQKRLKNKKYIKSSLKRKDKSPKKFKKPKKTLKKDSFDINKLGGNLVSLDDLSQTDRIFVLGKLSSMRSKNLFKSSERLPKNPKHRERIATLETNSPLGNTFALKRRPRESTPRKNIIVEETKEQYDDEETPVHRSESVEEEMKMPNSALKNYLPDISESDYQQ